MATKLIQESTLANIANAIRAKTGKADTMTPSEMVTEIGSISGGGDNTKLNGMIDRSITSISNSEVTSVGQNAFASCTALTSVDMPNVTSVGYSGFDGCTHLTSINMPKLTTLNGYSFRNCAMTEMRFPQWDGNKSSGGYAFYTCKSLQLVDYNNLKGIEGGCFGGCSALKVVILRKTSEIVTLANTNAFTGSGMLGADARVYVPQTLLTQYQQGTNWALMYADNNNLFQPLEGSPYENPNYDVATLLAS